MKGSYLVTRKSLQLVMLLPDLGELVVEIVNHLLMRGLLLSHRPAPNGSIVRDPQKGEDVALPHQLVQSF